MTEQGAKVSPDLYARIAGSLWLIVIVTGVFGLTAGAGLVAWNDPAVTARNILAKESLFRLSLLADLVAGVCYIGVTAMLYELLKPVSRSASLLAAFFGLGGVAIGGPAFLCRWAPLVLLRGEDYSSAFTSGQLQTLALTSLKLHAFAYQIGLVLFGVQCWIAGSLIWRSTFLPRIMGLFLAIAGTGYIVSSFANFLSPSLGAVVSPLVLPAGLLGEGALTLWLLVRGVNVSRWKGQANNLTRQ